MLSTDQIATFRRRGFIVLERLFTADEVSMLSAWLDALRTRTSGAGDDALYFEPSPVDGAPVLVRAEHVLGAHSAEVTALLLGERTVACVGDLIGDQPVLFKDKVNYKLPGCRADKLHQDQAAGWNAYTDFFVTMAIAVDPNRVDNAALTFLSSGDYERRVMGEEWQPLTEDDPPYEPASAYTVIEAEPGDAIVFDSYVPHGSPPNESGRSRRNVYLTFNRASAGDLRERYYADKWAVYPPNTPDDMPAARAYRV